MPLRGDAPLRFKLQHEYALVSEGHGVRHWSARTAAYVYELLDTSGDAVFAYHWHPIGRSSVTWPHLHVRGAVRAVDGRPLHLPTGHVPLDWFVWVAVKDFGVVPARADWETLLGPPISPEPTAAV